jgi:transposase
VLAARHDHLTSRRHNPLTAGQARAAVAGSLLRQIHAVVTKREPWNPKIAAGGPPQQEVPAAA